MVSKAEMYCFSPTGGTEKVCKAFVDAFACEQKMVDLAGKESMPEKPESDVIVVAVPVFGGRVPSGLTKKLQQLDGTGKKAVTIAVYGNRAYEDALLELNDVLTDRGFKVLASGVFIAQHSMAPAVGAGRPDADDMAEIKAFAEQVLVKLENGMDNEVHVPGNHPYKKEMEVVATPVSLPSCTLCGQCAAYCPADAICVEETVKTDLSKCILCVGCTKVCPAGARILPPPLLEKMDQKLAEFKTVRNKNEIYL